MGAYIKALKKFSSSKYGLIIPVNEDNEYIIWCHSLHLLKGRYLELITKDQQQQKRVSKYNRYVSRLYNYRISSNHQGNKKMEDKIISKSMKIKNNYLILIIMLSGYKINN